MSETEVPSGSDTRAPSFQERADISLSEALSERCSSLIFVIPEAEMSVIALSSRLRFVSAVSVLSSPMLSSAQFLSSSAVERGLSAEAGELYAAVVVQQQGLERLEARDVLRLVTFPAEASRRYRLRRTPRRQLMP